jgi:GNAT superfamily N-acetyltransferase
MYEIRPATLADLETIVHHRHAMFADMRYGTPESLAAMSAAFRLWLADRLASGAYLGWLAQAGDEIAAGSGLLICDFPPNARDQTGTRGLIINVYTEPPHRRRGLARQLTQAAIDWCRDQGINTVTLHASDQGRAIYESLGFCATNEMRLFL